MTTLTDSQGKAGAHSAGPWRACKNGECSCMQVWGNDHPVAIVTSGDWGDDYPAIRLTGNSSLDQKAEAYMEQITYGSVFPEVAQANARLIAAAPDFYHAATTGAQVNLPDFLDWIADRFVHVYGESPDVDFVHTCRDRAKLLRVAIAKATGSAA